MQVTVTTKGDKELDNLLRKLPVLVVSSGGPTDKAVRAAGAIVRDRAKALAPDSKRTGSRAKQSAKAKRIWTGKLRRLVRSRIRRYPKHSVAIIGPKNPEGNMAHFMKEQGRRHVLWGKATRVQQYRVARNWITQAFDETRTQQNAAMVASLKKSIAENMRGQ